MGAAPSVFGRFGQQRKRACSSELVWSLRSASRFNQLIADLPMYGASAPIPAGATPDAVRGMRRRSLSLDSVPLPRHSCLDSEPTPSSTPKPPSAAVRRKPPSVRALRFKRLEPLTVPTNGSAHASMPSAEEEMDAAARLPVSFAATRGVLTKQLHFADRHLLRAFIDYGVKQLIEHWSVTLESYSGAYHCQMPDQLCPAISGLAALRDDVRKKAGRPDAQLSAITYLPEAATCVCTDALIVHLDGDFARIRSAGKGGRSNATCALVFHLAPSVPVQTAPVAGG